MSLLWMESFDGPLLASRYQIFSSVNIGAGFGRNGSRGAEVGFCNVDSCIRKDIAATATLLFGAAIQPGTTDNTVDNISFWEGSTKRIAIRFINSTGALEVRSSGTLIGSAPAGTVIPDTFHYVEVLAVIDNVAGVVEIHVDGTQVFLFNGDTQGGASPVLDNWRLGGNSGASSRLNYDDIYVRNDTTFLGDVVVEARYPNGNGNYSQFGGSDGDSIDNFLLVDDGNTDDGDATYVVDGTAAQKDTYLFQDLTPAAAQIHGVMLTLAIRHEGAGGTFRAMLRRVSDAFGAAQTPPASYAALTELWEQDPIAAAAWTLANVNATEFGQEIVS